MGNVSAGARMASGMLIAGTPHRNLVRRLAAWVRSDWRTTRLLPGALVLLVTVSAIVAATYINHPQPGTTHDTPWLFVIAHRILTQGQFVDAVRMPAEPALIALISMLAGADNLLAMSIAQSVLFVLSVLVLYAATYLIYRRTWIAFVVATLVGTNLWLIAAVNFIMTEALAVVFATCLAMAAVLYVRKPNARTMWLVALATLLVIFSRAEWMYLPVPLFALLAYIAVRRGLGRRLVPHAIACTAVLLLVIFAYMAANARLYGFFGVTDTQSVNLLAKVMQYHMQNEAPPQYAWEAHIVNQFVEEGVQSPYTVIFSDPRLSRDHYALTGSYATAVVAGHPVEFLLDSIVFGIRSLPVAASGTYPHALIQQGNHLAWFLDLLYRPSLLEFASYLLFPAFALFWWVRFFRRSSREDVRTQTLAVVAFIAFYDFAMTSFGAFALDIAARTHTATDPLLSIVIWGSILWGMDMLVRQRYRASRNLVSSGVAAGVDASSVVR